MRSIRYAVSLLVLFGCASTELKDPRYPPRAVYRASPQEEARASCKLGYTARIQTFEQMVELCGNGRLNILAIGDSWFSFPLGNLLGPLRQAINDETKQPHINLLNLSTPGAEATQLLSGVQKHKLIQLLQDHRFRFILFSGGGNDLLGEGDLDRIIRHRPSRERLDPVGYVYRDRLVRKLERIRLAYLELLEIRDAYAPKATVVTHIYDRVKPRDARSHIFRSFGPWLSNIMDRKGIRDQGVQQDISDHILNGLRATIEEAARHDGTQNEPLIVLKTHGMLKPGDERHWQDEIHPTLGAFHCLGQQLVDRMKTVQEFLPSYEATLMDCKLIGIR